MIMNALAKKPLPVYGNGENVRDWLYVDDHARALYMVANEGQVGETYNIGGNSEKTNLDVVNTLCDVMNELRPAEKFYYRKLITHVTDRPGHDFRYAIDTSKIKRELGWQPEESFDTGLRKTVKWYLNNLPWCEAVAGGYDQERLGLQPVN